MDFGSFAIMRVCEAELKTAGHGRLLLFGMLPPCICGTK